MNTGLVIFLMVLALLVGIVIGIVSESYIRNKKEIHGIMRVNLNDPAKELYSLDLFCDLDRIPEFETIELAIQVEDREK
jgi:hypothetical protein